MILAQTHPALALATDLLQILPAAAQSDIPDREGYPSQILNVTIQQHPLSGVLTVTVRPGSPLDDPAQISQLQAIAQRHGANCTLPPAIQPAPGQPKAKQPKRQAKSS